LSQAIISIGLFQQAHVTALVGRFRQHLADRRLQPGVIVGDDELDAMQTALAQAREKIPPARPRLAVGQLDAEHLAAAVPIDADGDQIG
jgi:hypothetical protein